MKVKIHYTFLLLIIISLFSGLFKEMLIFSLVVILHELSHILMSFLFHKKTSKITLTIIGGIVDIENFDNNIFKGLLISISGIMTNFILIFLAKFITNDYYKTIFISYNRLMIAFNLLPIYPLDGYRILDFLVYGFKKSRRAINFMIIVSLFCCLLLGIYSLYIKSLGLTLIFIFLLIRNIYFYKNRDSVYLKRIINQIK